MTCFGMIAAVSLEALFLPDPLLQHPPSSPYHPRQESGFFAISRMVTGFGIWGWMQFTMCLCFGMCVISFLLCDHEIYIARCQKCLWIASPPACAEKIIKLRAVIPPKSTSTRRGTNVTLCHDRNTPSCWSSVSSFRFASAKKKKKKNPGLFAFWKLHCQNDLYVWKLWLCLSSVLGNSVLGVEAIRLPARNKAFSILWNHLIPCTTVSQLYIHFTKSQRFVTSLRAPRALWKAWKAVE